MIWILVVVAVIAVAAIAWLLARRRRPQAQIVRDRPTVARPKPGLGGRLQALLRPGTERSWDEVEEALVAVDMGVATASAVVSAVRAADDRGAEPWGAVRSELIARLGDRRRGLVLEGSPAPIVVVGVNGSGKTTTIAKIATMLAAGGRSVLLGAADTYRAAASEQLRSWADRLGVECVAGQAGADPASVAFDAVAAARSRGRDVVIIDTAGRLHVEKNLMEELRKVVRVVEREAGTAEVLLVIDGTTGQNGIAQARVFAEVAAVTGLVVTKLDGTARGGIAFAIEHELGIPIKLIGMGEGPGDLLHFDPTTYVDSLMEGP